MNISLNNRTEYPISNLGLENQPQSILAKEALWTLQLVSEKLIVRDLFDNFYVITELNVKRYKVTRALKEDQTFDLEKFWVWIIDFEDNLALYSFEPNIDSRPTVSIVRDNLAQNVKNIDIILKEQDLLRILVLSLNNTLVLNTYRDIYVTISPIVTNLYWDSTRLDDFSNYINDTKDYLRVVYSATGTPLNIYEDSYTINPPDNFNAILIPSTYDAYCSWNMQSEAEKYYLERDISIAFLNPQRYETTETHYIDTLPGVGDYYYRVRAYDEALGVFSPWSEVKKLIIDEPVTADFHAEPVLGSITTMIQFIDDSRGEPTSWFWDFGDDSTSTEQNPMHKYSEPGTYTITLTASDVLGHSTVRKTNYIEIKGTTTIDIATDPNLKAYLQGNGLVFNKMIGITIKSRDDEQTGFVRRQGPTLIFD